MSFFKQRNFYSKKPLRVTFEGKPAVDDGGPNREFFTILLRELLSPSATPRLFEGRNNIILPLHNTDALQSNLYKVAGRIVVALIIHGGPAFPYFPKHCMPIFKTLNLMTWWITYQDNVVDADYVDAPTKVESANSMTNQSQVEPLCEIYHKYVGYNILHVLQ